MKFLAALLVLKAAGAAGPLADAIRPADFVDLAEVMPQVRVRMMYSGSDNFVGRPIRGYKENLCLVTREAAKAMRRAGGRLAAISKREKRELRFEMRDCYRPAKATKDFLGWVEDPQAPGEKERFFPSLRKSEILSRHYLSRASGHSRGSTVDLTLVEALPEGGHRELDMGTRVDFLGEESHTENPNLGESARRARRWLLEAMEPDFKNYSKEWWHFTLREEPFPRKFFDFDVQ